MWKAARAILTLAAITGCAAEQPPPAPPEPMRDWWVFFDGGSAAIGTNGMATIKNFARFALEHPKSRITLTGHADRSGNAAYNMALSLRRADAVKRALIDQGLPAAAITTAGRGETQPLVQTADGVKEAQNRRVEFLLQ